MTAQRGDGTPAEGPVCAGLTLCVNALGRHGDGCPAAPDGEWDGSCAACGEVCDGDVCECPDDCPVPARGGAR